MYVQVTKSKIRNLSFAGAFLGFCFSYAWLFVFSLVPLVYYFYVMSKEMSIRESLCNQFVFFFFLHLVSLSFFWGMYPGEFLGLTKLSAFVLILFGWLGLSVLMSCFYLLIPLVSQLVKVSVSQRGIVVVILWTLVESFFEVLGFPWIRMGLFTLLHPMLSYVASIGSVFVCSLLWLGLACVISWKRVGYIALLLVVWCLPSLLVNYEIKETYSVALIQGNISSHDKWNRDNQEIHSNLLNRVSEDVDAIFMAETVFTDSNYKSEALYQSFNKPTFFGAFEVIDSFTYNALCSTLEETCYHKRTLVPFGEYMPRWASNILPFLNNFQLAGNLGSGKENVILESPMGKISSLLCFESIFPSLLEEGDLIYIASNDSWFDGSNEQFKHLQHARMRSIEQGKDGIRVGNTGGTCLIDAKGNIVECLSLYSSGVLEGEVHTYESVSIFARYSIISTVLKFVCLLYICWVLYKDFDSLKWVDLKLMLYPKR